MTDPGPAEPTAPAPPSGWRTAEGSTGRLVQLCVLYFLFYAFTGVALKYFTGKPADGFVGIHQMKYLAYSTLGGTTVCLVWVLARGWYRLKTTRAITWMGITLPSEIVYIIPSGICTAVVIPTTTMMYMLPISVMVAMVIMRGCIIVVSRLVDALQIAQGILRKKVYVQEELAVAFAVAAVGLQIYYANEKGGEGSFAFAKDPLAMSILGSYVVAYTLRIYLMNYFKNTRGKGVPLDNNGFFALEQIAAAAAMASVAAVVYFTPTLFGMDLQAIHDAKHAATGAPTFQSWYAESAYQFRGAISEPPPAWGWATLSGVVYGLVAFVSVFIFMFKGRTATFAGLVNRLTSLIAGTAATLILSFGFGGKMPESTDWYSFGLIMVAVGFLTLAERRRAQELTVAPEPDKP